MSVENHHPAYTEYEEDWRLMRHSYAGERVVKKETTKYLPATGNMQADGMQPGEEGLRAYEAYKTRARYPNYVRSAVQTAVGMLFHNEFEVICPPRLTDLLDGITSDGEDVNQLLRKVATQQLISGRVGLLVDVDERSGNPYIAAYAAESIINWDGGFLRDPLSLVVLNETRKVRSDFTWQDERAYRVLSLDDQLSGDPSRRVYTQRVVTGTIAYEGAVSVQPSVRGRNLDYIPFVFVNASDHVPTPDQPPLLDLANLCMAIYRAEADYRQNLFMQGQDTLVIIGGAGLGDDEDVRTGAGSMIAAPLGGDAKYIGVESDGLREQREALQYDHRMAGSMGSGTLDTTSRERESGSSLSVRLSARTSSLRQIGLSCAKGVEKMLRACAELLGESPDEVSVTPNEEYGEAPVTGQTLVDLQAARNSGAPYSARSLHDFMRSKGFTSSSYEEEMETIREERRDGTLIVGNGDRNPEQQESEDVEETT